MKHKDEIKKVLSTFLSVTVELFAFLVALKGEMAMFYMKVIFCSGLERLCFTWKSSFALV